MMDWVEVLEIWFGGRDFGNSKMYFRSVTEKVLEVGFWEFFEYCFEALCSRY